MSEKELPDPNIITMLSVLGYPEKHVLRKLSKDATLVYSLCILNNEVLRFERKDEYTINAIYTICYDELFLLFCRFYKVDNKKAYKETWNLIENVKKELIENGLAKPGEWYEIWQVIVPFDSYLFKRIYDPSEKEVERFVDNGLSIGG